MPGRRNGVEREGEGVLSEPENGEGNGVNEQCLGIGRGWRWGHGVACIHGGAAECGGRVALNPELGSALEKTTCGWGPQVSGRRKKRFRVVHLGGAVQPVGSGSGQSPVQPGVWLNRVNRVGQQGLGSVKRIVLGF